MASYCRCASRDSKTPEAVALWLMDLGCSGPKKYPEAAVDYAVVPWSRLMASLFAAHSGHPCEGQHHAKTDHTVRRER